MAVFDMYLMMMMIIMMVLMMMMMVKVRVPQEKATRQDGDCCGVKILVKFGTVTFVIIIIVIIIIVIIIIISMITMIMIIHLNICPRSTSAIDNKCKARTLFRSGNHGDEISGW